MTETVEQFLARGQEITQVPYGKSGLVNGQTRRSREISDQYKKGQKKSTQAKNANNKAKQS